MFSLTSLWLSTFLIWIRRDGGEVELKLPQRGPGVRCNSSSQCGVQNRAYIPPKTLKQVPPQLKVKRCGRSERGAVGVERVGNKYEVSLSSTD